VESRYRVCTSLSVSEDVDISLVDSFKVDEEHVHVVCPSMDLFESDFMLMLNVAC
jgi:hypothetical protein